MVYMVKTKTRKYLMVTGDKVFDNEYINSLGQEGWEMRVGMQSHVIGPVLYFMKESFNELRDGGE